jgi:hypothetical protein
VAVSAVLVFTLGVSAVTLARAEVPSPTVEGPITSPGDPFTGAPTIDLAAVGYQRGPRRAAA